MFDMPLMLKSRESDNVCRTSLTLERQKGIKKENLVCLVCISSQGFLQCLTPAKGEASAFYGIQIS